jgi:Flp pilus assembly protein TadD
MSKATRFAPSLVALLLGCSALSSAAQAGWFSSDSTPAAAKTDNKAASAPQPGTNLDDSIRQAQMLRLAGNYAEALNHLSQMMIVAADDSRVISEYGKTLVSMGRTDEAEKFLTRAQQLQPNDWTIYSALGVAYDQMGNQKDAQTNYEGALALKPGEPSVLNNYALSRMLAKDPVTARKLADRAEIANAAAHDDKIARNIAMIRSMAPDASNNFTVNTPAPSPVPVAAPHVAVAAAPLAPIPGAEPVPLIIHPAPAPMASNAPPRPLANTMVAQVQPQPAQPLNQKPRGVVMQTVPVDPLAGPVQGAAKAGPVESKPTATHAPRSLQPNTVQAGSETPVKTAAKADAPKPAAEPAKPASPAQSLEAKAEAVAKTLTKPGAITQAKLEANRDMPAKSEPAKPAQPAMAQAKPEASKTLQAKSEPAKPAQPAMAQAKPEASKTLQAKSEPTKPAQPAMAQAKPEASKTLQAKSETTKPAAPAAALSVPVKAADVKPSAGQSTPKVLASAPMKAAEAKSAAGKTAAAKPKDVIPGLRLSANAY